MTDRTRFIVVPLNELIAEEGPHAFEFKKPTDGQHSNLNINFTYNGKQLYVRYDRRTTPFGISAIRERKDTKVKNDKSGKIVGYSIAFSFKRNNPDGTPSDPLLAKMEELDEFFMDMAHKYQIDWKLGTKKAPLSREIGTGSIPGIDEKGDKGKWKRLVRYAYSVNADNDREYNDQYPPRYEISVPHKEVEGESRAVFPNIKFFDEAGEELESVDSTNIESVCPKYSECSVLASWGRLSAGQQYGLTMKARLQQIRIYPSASRPNENMLIDDVYDEDVEALDLGKDGLGASSSSARVPAAQVSVEDVETVEYDEAEPPAPAPPAPVTAPAATSARPAARKVVPRKTTNA
jgi:hypothetical protein